MEDLYYHYIQFLSRDIPRQEWIRVKELLYWTTMSRERNAKFEDVFNAVNALLSYPDVDGSSRIVQDDISKAIDICKPFFGESVYNVLNPPRSAVQDFLNMMKKNPTLANDVGFDIKDAARRLVLTCISKLLVELYDGYDSKRTDPRISEVTLLTGPDCLSGPVFVCYSAVHWHDHLSDFAGYNDMNVEVQQSVVQFLAKFEARYKSTKLVEPDLLRWISFARAAVGAGGVCKQLSAPFSISLLNGLQERYEHERSLSSASEWYSFARTAERDYAGLPNVDPIAYVHHLEQAVIQFNDQGGCQDLEELTSLYERWERQYPHLVRQRYSLAFREWLSQDDQRTDDLTGYFSVGVEGEGMLETNLHVRYPAPLMVRMINNGEKLCEIVKDLEGHITIGLDRLPPEIQPAIETDNQFFTGENSDIKVIPMIRSTRQFVDYLFKVGSFPTAVFDPPCSQGLEFHCTVATIYCGFGIEQRRVIL